MEWIEEQQESEKEGVRLMNPHIQTMQEDVLYHLALGSGSHDLEQMFGDVRFICMGGTPQRMKTFAEYMLGQLGYLLPTGTCLLDISERSHRYAMYKVGPILSISHGMGIPSAGILLHEVIIGWDITGVKLGYHNMNITRIKLGHHLTRVTLGCFEDWVGCY